MDDVKRTYRDVEKDSKQAWRESDGGEGPADKVGDAGDEIRKDLGNAGDTIGEVGQDVRRDVERAPLIPNPFHAAKPLGAVRGLRRVRGFAASGAPVGPVAADVRGSCNAPGRFRKRPSDPAALA